MTKLDLVVRIAQKTGLIQKDVGIVVQQLLDELTDEIFAGHTVELRNFGVFDVVIRKKRTGRNPKHPEEKVVIPERSQVKFSAGKALKRRVVQLGTARICGD